MAGKWGDVKRIFQHCLELPPEAREGYLRDACGGDPETETLVRRMLDADQADHSLLDGGAGPIPAGEADPELNEGAALGPYRLRRQVGEGGMGEVWLAEQGAPVRRSVALKILKLGMDSRRIVARFAAERQALAVMDHPAIAKVFDAGTTGRGRPWFSMEFVDGSPITTFCDGERLRTRDRLLLFIEVCEGVQHAHHKGIIHRDLKPSNVLVARRDGHPAPKVIDFGIAKATDPAASGRTALTRAGMLVGTPEYMSPEQFGDSQDIDTRADVYSLGVLLYELLTGTLPGSADGRASSGGSSAEVSDADRPSHRLRSLTAEDTTRISRARGVDGVTLERRLKGDLDWIVIRAIERERSRRYGSPGELAADIRRHLAHEPVEAGPPGAAYRMRKFVRRHRVGVGFAAVLGVVLIASAVALGIQARRLARTAAELSQVAEFQAERLREISPASMGAQLRDSLLESRRTRLERAGLPAEAVQRGVGELRTELDSVNFTDIARGTLDANIFAPALEAADREFGEQPLVRARLLQSLATILARFWLYPEAERPQTEALAIRTRLLGERHPETIETMYNTAQLLRWLGRREEAVALERRAAPLAGEVRGPDDPLALLLDFRTNPDPVRRTQIVETMYRVLGEEHPRSTATEIELAGYLLARGDLQAAERHHRHVLEVRERVLGPDDYLTTHARFRWGGALFQLGRWDEGEAALRQALPRIREYYGDLHEETLNATVLLATLLEMRGDLDAAEPMFRSALEVSENLLGPTAPTTIQTLHNFGFLLYRQGHFDEAEAMLRRSLEQRRAALGATAPAALANQGNLALVLVETGRAAEAEPLAREAVAGLTESYGGEHWLVDNARGQLGLALCRLGRFAEAERELLEAHRNLVDRLGEQHARAQRVAGYLVDLYRRWDATVPGAGHATSASRWHVGEP